MRRIGVLMNVAVDDPEGQARIAAFHQGLQERGWTLGRNARIDARWYAVAFLFPHISGDVDFTDPALELRLRCSAGFTGADVG